MNHFQRSGVGQHCASVTPMLGVYCALFASSFNQCKTILVVCWFFDKYLSTQYTFFFFYLYKYYIVTIICFPTCFFLFRWIFHYDQRQIRVFRVFRGEYCKKYCHLCHKWLFLTIEAWKRMCFVNFKPESPLKLILLKMIKAMPLMV